MKLSLTFLVGISLLSGLLGCSTAQVLTGGDDIKTGFLLSYRMEFARGVEKNQQCAIELSGSEPQVNYTLALDPLAKSVEVEVPEGTYQIKTLACGGPAHWKLDNFGAKEVRVIAGKVAFLGHFTFRISKKDSVYELSMQRGNREETRKNLIAMGHAHSASWRARLVSAYQGTGWSQEYLESESNYLRGSTARIEGTKPQLNHLDFTDCEIMEFQKNPVPLGVLSIKSSYEGDHNISVQTVAERHTFSDDFISCVKETLRTFRPGTPRPIAYYVNL